MQQKQKRKKLARQRLKRSTKNKSQNSYQNKDYSKIKNPQERVRERVSDLRSQLKKDSHKTTNREILDAHQNQILTNAKNLLDDFIYVSNDIISQGREYVKREIARKQEEDEELLRIWLEEEEQDTRKNKELEERYMGVITDEDFAMEVSEMVKYFDLMDDYYNTTTSPSKNRDGGASIFQILIDFDENPYKFEIETIFKFGTMVTGAEALAELTMQAIQADEALIYLDYHVKEIEKLVPVEVI